MSLAAAACFVLLAQASEPPRSFAAIDRAATPSSEIDTLLAANYRNNNPAHRTPFEGVDWGGGYFGGGAGYGYDFPSSSLDPTERDSFFTVEIRFDALTTQKAYRFMRLENPDGLPPPQGRGWLYGGYHPVPFTCWDLTHDRQIAVAFVERVRTEYDGSISPPSSQPATCDSTWAPDTSALGGREYLCLLFTTYTATADPFIARDGSPFDGTLPILYSLWARRLAVTDVVDNGDAFRFDWGCVKPDVDAGPNREITCSKLQEVLGGSSTTPGATYSWTARAGGNIVSGATTAAPTVNQAGTYVLTVTDPGNGCTAIDSTYVTANRTPPNVSAGPDRQINCSGPTVALLGSSTTPGAMYSWAAHAGGNIVSGATTATPTVNQTGIYVLMVTDPANGCTSIDSTQVTINRTPPDASAGPDRQINCSGPTVALSGSSATPGATFSWAARAGGNIVSGAATASPTVNQAGIYVLTVTDLANACTSIDSTLVTINRTPPDVSAGPDRAISCIKPTEVLSGSSTTPGAIYSWAAHAGGNIVSGAATAAPTVNQAGIYVLTVTDPANVCTSIDSALVTADLTPPDVSAGPDKSACAGGSVVLQGTSATPGVNFSWAAGPGGHIVSGANTPTPTVDASATYTLTVTNPTSGCTASDGAVATLSGATPSVASTDPDHGRVGSSVRILGSGFTSNASVDFNGTVATNVSFVSASELSARIPAGAWTGPVHVVTCAAANGPVFHVSAVTAVTPGASHYVGFAIPIVAGSSLNVDSLGLGQEDRTQWRLFHWSPGTKAYLEAGNTTPLTVGQGYWLITRAPASIEVADVLAPPASLDVPLEPVLGDAENAWNELGNPFETSLRASDLLVRVGSGPPLHLTDPGGPTDPLVWVWEADWVSVEGDALIEPHQAFWVHKHLGQDVTLTMSPATGGPISPPRQTNPDWSVALTARQGSFTCLPVKVGVMAAQAGSQEVREIAIPPDPPGRRLRLTIAPDSAAQTALVTAYASPRDGLSWHLLLQTADSPGEVTLSVETVGLPGDWAPRLVDAPTGQSWPLHSGQTISLAATEGPRRLELEVGPLPSDSHSIAMGRSAYPNPFGDRVGFRFANQAPADIEVAVFDLGGRLVWRAERSRVPAGEHVLVWSGEMGSGASAGPGIYFARYRIGAQQGVWKIVRL